MRVLGLSSDAMSSSKTIGKSWSSDGYMSRSVKSLFLADASATFITTDSYSSRFGSAPKIFHTRPADCPTDERGSVAPPTSLATGNLRRAQYP